MDICNSSTTEWDSSGMLPVAIIIPARVESRRLPGKLLLSETGKPLIQHTWEAAQQSKLAKHVFIASGDPEIWNAASQFSGYMIRTDDKHANGTSRVIEAANTLPFQPHVVVNLQADEAAITGNVIDLLIFRATHLHAMGIATLASPLRPDGCHDTDCVKVVVGHRDRALYFSRAPLAGAMEHVGAYAFRWPVLKVIQRMPSSMPAVNERLEQICWLDHGLDIRVVKTAGCSRSINNMRDYVLFRKSQEPGGSRP